MRASSMSNREMYGWTSPTPVENSPNKITTSRLFQYGETNFMAGRYCRSGITDPPLLEFIHLLKVHAETRRTCYPSAVARAVLPSSDQLLVQRRHNQVRCRVAAELVVDR